MTSARITKLLLLSALIAIPCAAQQPLQFTIYQTSTKPTFQGELYNSGKETLNLSFGVQFEIGHAMSAIRVAITDAQGKKVTLDMRDPYAGDALRGQTVGLPGAMLSPGRTYSLSIDLEDYLTQPLAPGQYSLQAIYTGADMGANFQHNIPQFWIGSAISNIIFFTIPESAAQQAQNQAPFTLTISQTSPKPAFQAEFHNAGLVPLHLFMNHWTWLDRIYLTLTDATGKTTHLSPYYPPDFTGGTVSEGGPTIQPGQTLSIPINLSDYCLIDDSVREDQIHRLSLAPGQYSLKAVFDGLDHFS